MKFQTIALIFVISIHHLIPSEAIFKFTTILVGKKSESNNGQIEIDF